MKSSCLACFILGILGCLLLPGSATAAETRQEVPLKDGTRFINLINPETRTMVQTKFDAAGRVLFVKTYHLNDRGDPVQAVCKGPDGRLWNFEEFIYDTNRRLLRVNSFGLVLVSRRSAEEAVKDGRMGFFRADGQPMPAEEQGRTLALLEGRY
jgi:hypothetical protein